MTQTAINQELAEFKNYIRDRRTAVLGIGISNRPLIRFLHRLGADITAFDMLPADDPVLAKTRQDFEEEGIHLNWSVGEGYLERLEGFEIVFRTPRMRCDGPELQAELARGAIITSEMEVFLALCPAPVIGVTGSDGKTTTTTLIAEILEAAGCKVRLGGNIGTPLLDRIEEVRADDKVVVELSSFQLLSMRQSCETALITNISPNHLDFHTDYREYIDAKKNIFVNQSFLGRLILNARNSFSEEFVMEARGQVVWTNDNPDTPHVGLAWGGRTWLDADGILMAQGFKPGVDDHGVELVKREEILIPGRFNVENLLAAAAATLHIDAVNPDIVAHVARTFEGVPHRLEFIRELDGVRWYNSGIDTGPSRSIATLSALADSNAHGVLIMGGQDKNSDYSGLGESVLAVSRKIILLGQNADLLRAEIQRASEVAGVFVSIVDVEDYETAVALAEELAMPGEVVVLTPAGTSYDRFRHFEERGNLYRELVRGLKNDRPL